MSMYFTSKRILVVSGYTQTFKRRTGSELLHSRLRYEFDDPTNEVSVDRLFWNDNYKDYVKYIHRNAPYGIIPKVVVFSYSWGAGWWFRKFAWEMYHAGLKIDCSVLCDPVYRFGISKLFSPISLLPTCRLVLAPSVKECYWFYQRQGFPRGHTVVPKYDINNPLGEVVTNIHHGVELYCTHSWADDSKEYHDKCMEVASALCTADPYSH